MPPDEPAIPDLLPLPAASFQILLALAGQDLHGYGIMLEIEERTGGEVRMSAGTLYRSIQRMLEQGLIVERTKRPAPADDDPRRRYYGITKLGRAVAGAEASRLAELVRAASAVGLHPRRAT
ncbi:MAG: PadR family transcriptional regulator [Longimicrobiales bacterium]